MSNGNSIESRCYHLKVEVCDTLKRQTQYQVVFFFYFNFSSSTNVEQILCIKKTSLWYLKNITNE